MSEHSNIHRKGDLDSSRQQTALPQNNITGTFGNYTTDTHSAGNGITYRPSSLYPLALAPTQHAALLDRYKRDHNLNAIFTVTNESLEEFHKNFGKMFSKFKYGDPDSIKFFGQLVADNIVYTHGRENLIQNAILLAPAYRSVKTSAVLLTEAVQLALQDNHGIVVEIHRLSRRAVSGGDYGLLKTMEARAAQIFHKFGYDGPDIKDKTVLFIEDTLVSGAHYLETQRALEECAGVQLNNIYGHFIADVQAETFGDKQYAVEDVLNHLWVSKTQVERLTEILREPRVLATPRTLKLILESPWVQVEATLDNVPLDVVLQVEYASKTEELNKHEQYQSNYSHLREYALNRLKAFKEAINLSCSIQVDSSTTEHIDVKQFKHPRFDRLLSISEMYSLLKFGDAEAVEIFAQITAASLKKQFNGIVDPLVHCIAVPSYADTQGSAALLAIKVAEKLGLSCVEVKRMDIPKVSYGTIADSGKRHEVVKEAIYKIEGSPTQEVILIEDSVVSGSNIKALTSALMGNNRTIHPHALINLDTLELELEEKLNTSIIAASNPDDLVALINAPGSVVVARTIKEVFASGEQNCKIYGQQINLSDAIKMANLGRINGFDTQPNYKDGFNAFIDELNKRIRENKDQASNDGTNLPPYETLYILSDGESSKIITDRFASQYSKAKYGDTESTEQFAQKLAVMIKNRLQDQIVEDPSKWVVAGTHYFRTPNAASYLTRRVATLLELPVADVRRRSIFEGEFGALSDPESRKKAMEGQTVISVPEQIQGKNVIYIDDLYASGTHLKEHHNALTQAGAELIHSYAIIDVAVDDLSAEKDLNYAGISTKGSSDIIQILSDPKAPLLTRTMKLLLKLPPNQFEKALEQLPIARVFQLTEQAKLEGYDVTDSMKDNFATLESRAHLIHQMTAPNDLDSILQQEFRLMLFDFDETLSHTLTPLSDEAIENLLFFMERGTHIGIQSLQPIKIRGLVDNALEPIRNYLLRHNRDLTILSNLHLLPDQGVSAYRIDTDGQLIEHPVYRVGFSPQEWQQLQDIIESTPAGQNAIKKYIRGGYISLHYSTNQEMSDALVHLKDELSDFPTEVVFSTKVSQDGQKFVMHLKSAAATKMIGRQYMLNEVATLAGIYSDADARTSILVAGDKMGSSRANFDDTEMLTLGGTNLALGEEIHPSANGMYARRYSEGLMEFLTILRRSKSLVVEE